MLKKVALITGAGRGIGKALALRLAKDGFNVVINDINKNDAQKVEEEVKRLGRKSLAIVADVSKKDEVYGMVSEVVQEFDRLDVMISNAGIAHVRKIHDITSEELEKMFETNVFGVFYCLQAASEQMIRQGGGKIINAASVAGRRGAANLSHYSGTKFAVVGFTQAAAQELAPHGITVNAYCPGIVDTDMWKEIDRGFGYYLNLKEGEAMEDSIRKKVSLGRAETPEDIEGIVSYLASDESNYMTGQSIVIDGGMVFP